MPFQPATTKAAAKVPEVLKGIPHLTSSNLWNLRSLPPRIQLNNNSDCEHWIPTCNAPTLVFLVFRGCRAVENSSQIQGFPKFLAELQDGSSWCRAYWLGLLAEGLQGIKGIQGPSSESRWNGMKWAILVCELMGRWGETTCNDFFLQSKERCRIQVHHLSITPTCGRCPVFKFWVYTLLCFLCMPDSQCV